MMSGVPGVGGWLGTATARFRRGGRPALAWTVRLTLAAVAAYVVCQAIFPDPRPLLAPLTALLVVQLTPVSLLASGLDRVLAVVAGVVVAVVFAAAVQLTWWSLGAIIAVALLLGQVLRLGPNLVEVPISAMLVLGVGAVGAESAGWLRVAETFIGAGVGVVSNLLVPPRVPAGDAGSKLDDVADELAGLLSQAAAQMVDTDGTPAELNALAGRWLAEARRLTHDIPALGTTLLRAEQARRLNLRALGTPDAGPGLRHGMEALEHSAVAVRSMFRSMFDATASGRWPDGELGRDLRGAIALLLSDLAAGVQAFGHLVGAEARGGRHGQVELVRLETAWEGMLEARARVTELVLADDPALAEFQYSLLITVRRLVSELDLGARIRRQSPSRLPATPR